MRDAPPPVQWLLGAGRAHRWWPLVLTGVAAAAAAAWCLWHGWLPTAGVVFAAALAMAAAWGFSRRQATDLWSWDGQVWRDADQQPGVLELRLDLGGLLLLRTRSADARRWQWWWVSAKESPSQWHGLRLVLAHAGRAARPPAAPRPSV